MKNQTLLLNCNQPEQDVTHLDDLKYTGLFNDTAIYQVRVTYFLLFCILSLVTLYADFGYSVHCPWLFCIMSLATLYTVECNQRVQDATHLDDPKLLYIKSEVPACYFPG